MKLAVAVDNSEREEPVRRKMPLSGVTLDKELQPRAKIDGPTVDRYAEMLLDGVVMPPVVVVYDGEKFWLADGFHRVYGHEKAGLREIEAEIHYGSKLDAIRISLKANAEHGRPRSDRDLQDAYDLAVKHGLVDAGSVEKVAAIIACHPRHAQRLTESVRNAREAELRQKMFELKEQGFSILKIAKALDVDRGVVQRYFESLKPSRRDDTKRTMSETCHPEDVTDPPAADDDLERVERFTAADAGEPEAAAHPERVADGGHPEPEPEPEDEAEPTAEHDPLAAYNEQWRAETPQREMWGKALTVLQEFAHLPEPEVLFANRYTRFDYLIKPAVDNAFNWLEAFEEKWHGPQNR
jgi:ParB-like chromosome segregation protein Spo0J